MKKHSSYQKYIMYGAGQWDGDDFILVGGTVCHRASASRKAACKFASQDSKVAKTWAELVKDGFSIERLEVTLS